jgi:hypothetical protein
MNLRITFILLLALVFAGCAETNQVGVTPLRAAHKETADYTVGATAICEVHHIPMVRTTVPIAYGLIMPTAQAEARYAASTNAFPHAETYVCGGCCVYDESPQKAVIYVCPECTKAAKEWDATHKEH